MVKNHLIKVSRRVYFRFYNTLHVIERFSPAAFLPQFSVTPFHKLTAIRFSSATLLSGSSVAPFHTLDVAAVIHFSFAVVFPAFSCLLRRVVR